MTPFIAQLHAFLADGTLSLAAPQGSAPVAFMDATIRVGNIALTAVDLSLILLCPFCAALGVLVSHIVKNRGPRSQGSNIAKFPARVRTLAGNLFLGLVLGLVVALFFVGAITGEVTSLARVLALTILLGYQAQHVWARQERAFKQVVDEQMEAASKEIRP